MFHFSRYMMIRDATMLLNILRLLNDGDFIYDWVIDAV